MCRSGYLWTASLAVCISWIYTVLLPPNAEPPHLGSSDPSFGFEDGVYTFHLEIEQMMNASAAARGPSASAPSLLNNVHINYSIDATHSDTEQTTLLALPAWNSSVSLQCATTIVDTNDACLELARNLSSCAPHSWIAVQNTTSAEITGFFPRLARLTAGCNAVRGYAARLFAALSHRLEEPTQTGGYRAQRPAKELRRLAPLLAPLGHMPITELYEPLLTASSGEDRCFTVTHEGFAPGTQQGCEDRQVCFSGQGAGVSRSHAQAGHLLSAFQAEASSWPTQIQDVQLSGEQVLALSRNNLREVWTLRWNDSAAVWASRRTNDGGRFARFARGASRYVLTIPGILEKIKFTQRRTQDEVYVADYQGNWLWNDTSSRAVLACLPGAWTITLRAELYARLWAPGQDAADPCGLEQLAFFSDWRNASDDTVLSEPFVFEGGSSSTLAHVVDTGVWYLPVDFLDPLLRRNPPRESGTPLLAEAWSAPSPQLLLGVSAAGTVLWTNASTQALPQLFADGPRGAHELQTITGTPPAAAEAPLPVLLVSSDDALLLCSPPAAPQGTWTTAVVADTLRPPTDDQTGDTVLERPAQVRGAAWSRTGNLAVFLAGEDLLCWKQGPVNLTTTVLDLPEYCPLLVQAPAREGESVAQLYTLGHAEDGLLLLWNSGRVTFWRPDMLTSFADVTTVTESTACSLQPGQGLGNRLPLAQTPVLSLSVDQDTGDVLLLTRRGLAVLTGGLSAAQTPPWSLVRWLNSTAAGAVFANARQPPPAQTSPGAQPLRAHSVAALHRTAHTTLASGARADLRNVSAAELATALPLLPEAETPRGSRLVAEQLVEGLRAQPTNVTLKQQVARALGTWNCTAGVELLRANLTATIDERLAALEIAALMSPSCVEVVRLLGDALAQPFETEPQEARVHTGAVLQTMQLALRLPSNASGGPQQNDVLLLLHALHHRVQSFLAQGEWAPCDAATNYTEAVNDSESCTDACLLQLSASHLGWDALKHCALEDTSAQSESPSCFLRKDDQRLHWRGQDSQQPGAGDDLLCLEKGQAVRQPFSDNRTVCSEEEPSTSENCSLACQAAACRGVEQLSSNLSASVCYYDASVARMRVGSAPSGSVSNSLCQHSQWTSVALLEQTLVSVLGAFAEGDDAYLSDEEGLAHGRAHRRLRAVGHGFWQANRALRHSAEARRAAREALKSLWHGHASLENATFLPLLLRQSGRDARVARQQLLLGRLPSGNVTALACHALEFAARTRDLTPVLLRRVLRRWSGICPYRHVEGFVADVRARLDCRAGRWHHETCAQAAASLHHLSATPPQTGLTSFSHDWSLQLGNEQAAVRPYFRVDSAYGSEQQESQQQALLVSASASAGVDATLFGHDFKVGTATASAFVLADPDGIVATAFLGLLVYGFEPVFSLEHGLSLSQNEFVVYVAGLQGAWSAPLPAVHTDTSTCDFTGLDRAEAHNVAAFSLAVLDLYWSWGIPVLGALDVELQVIGSADFSYRMQVSFDPDTDWSKPLEIQPLLALRLEPSLEASLSLSADVSLLVARAGVRGTANLLTLGLPLDMGARLPDDWGVVFSGEYSFLSGQVDAFLDLPGCSGCGWFCLQCGLGSGHGGSTLYIPLLTWHPLGSGRQNFYTRSLCSQSSLRDQVPIGVFGALSAQPSTTSPPRFRLQCSTYPDVCLNIACSMLYYASGRQRVSVSQDTTTVRLRYLPRGSWQRRLSLAGLPRCPGRDRDEHPPASSIEGGCYARIMCTEPWQNQEHGRQLAAFLRRHRIEKFGAFEYEIENSFLQKATADICRATDMRVNANKWWPSSRADRTTRIRHCRPLLPTSLSRRPSFGVAKPRPPSWRSCLQGVNCGSSACRPLGWADP